MNTLNTYKNISGYESIYLVDDNGNVFNKELNKIMSSKSDGKGYINVGLTKNKERKFHKIHRLVAIEFIPNPENKPQVNHINGIKTDNRVENLEWCTRSENMVHAYDNGLNKPITKPVVMFNKSDCVIRDFSSINEASSIMGIKDSNISFVCNGKRKSAGGYKWKYKK